MSKIPFEGSENLDDELLMEYNFNHKQVNPNRFATGGEKKALKPVVLDESVLLVAGKVATHPLLWQN